AAALAKRRPPLDRERVDAAHPPPTARHQVGAPLQRLDRCLFLERPHGLLGVHAVAVAEQTLALAHAPLQIEPGALLVLMRGTDPVDRGGLLPPGAVGLGVALARLPRRLHRGTVALLSLRQLTLGYSQPLL